MPSWLRTLIFGGWAGVADEIKQLLNQALGGLASWIQSLFGTSKQAWTELWAAFDGLAQDTDYFGNRVWLNLNWTGRSVIPSLARYVDAFNRRQDSWNAKWHALLWQRDAQNHDFTVSQIGAAKLWALGAIFLPLSKLIIALTADVLKWAYWAFQLLNDPPRLAGMLLWPLTAVMEATWEAWTLSVGDWVGKLILHNLLKVIHLAEQILSDVL
jgi:hypothetical protein